MSKAIVEPYLFFGGRCEEAIEFYSAAIGATKGMLMRFSDSPDPLPPGMVPAGYENKVMHSSFNVGDRQIMASDGCEEGSTFSGFSLSITVETEEDADRYFNALAEGGQVTMPLNKTFWSPRYGMLVDKFGVNWMVYVPGGPPS